jgi:hypothetical protein
MRSVREELKRVLPDPLVEWIRRRKALRLYLKELSYEIYYSQTSLDNEELEARIAARREGAYGQLVRDVLERTDILLQELDRRIEGLNARVGNDIRTLNVEIAELRASLQALRDSHEAVALPRLPKGQPVAIGTKDRQATIHTDAPAGIGTAEE